MYIYQRKVLFFDCKNWYFGDYGYYIARRPGTDFLHIVGTSTGRSRVLSKVVTIADFIMAHSTNSRRLDSAEFVFKALEWHDNICIRSAYELDKIKSDPDFSRSKIIDGNSLRIVNGELWTRSDYEIERNVMRSVDRPFDDYPELDYGVLCLPPFLDPRDSTLTPLKPAGWNSTPDFINWQLDPPKWRGLPDWAKFKGSEFVTRM